MKFECKNIFKKYGGLNVLQDISLTLSSDYITVLMGYSGSGKTTLLRCLALLEHPDSGKIFLGEDVLTYPYTENKEQQNKFYPDITVVFQQLFLWPNMTCLDNLKLVTKNDQNIQYWIDFFEMKNFIGKYPNKVSLGQKQRIALTRAFLVNPKVLLLDEVTSALDHYYANKVYEALADLLKNGVKIAAVTHQPEFTKNTKSRVYELLDGSIKLV